MQQVPVLETPDGPLTESSAIARYIASLSSRHALYPQSDDPSDTTRALIDAWIDWATVLDKATRDWVEPMFGEGPQQPAAVDAAKAEFEKALQTLNMHLGSRTYLVGETLTLADLVVVSHLLLLYLTVRSTHTHPPPPDPPPPTPSPPPPTAKTYLTVLLLMSPITPPQSHLAWATCMLSVPACNRLLVQHHHIGSQLFASAVGPHSVSWHQIYAYNTCM